MTDRDGIARDLDLAGETPVHAVISEQMGIGFHAAEVVDGDRNDILPPAFDDRAQHEAPNPTEPVDRDLHWHVGNPFLSLIRTVSQLFLTKAFTDRRDGGVRGDPEMLI